MGDARHHQVAAPALATLHTTSPVRVAMPLIPANTPVRSAYASASLSPARYSRPARPLSSSSASLSCSLPPPQLPLSVLRK